MKTKMIPLSQPASSSLNSRRIDSSAGTHDLGEEQIQLLFAQIAEHTAALKTLEARVRSRLFSERNQVKSDSIPYLLNAKQLAEHLAVPESWVYEQARIGELPSIKVGHYVRFRLDDVKNYLADKTTSPQAPAASSFRPPASTPFRSSP
jgi:excisionase family DNA binding protein